MVQELEGGHHFWTVMIRGGLGLTREEVGEVIRSQIMPGFLGHIKDLRFLFSYENSLKDAK